MGELLHSVCSICEKPFDYEYTRGSFRTRCDKHRHTAAPPKKPEVIITEVRPLEEMRATGLRYHERKTLKHLVGKVQLRRYLREKHIKL